VREENRESGKRDRGVNDNSSFRLNAPENAVRNHKAPIILEHGTPTVSVYIEGMSRTLILDTGANISIVQPGISRCNVQVTMMEPYGVTGDNLDIRGQQTVPFRLNGGRFTQPFLVRTLPTKAAGLLGTDFLNQVGAKIDFAAGKLSVDHTEGASHTCSVPPIGHVALTVFSQGKAGHRPLPEKRGTEREDQQLPASLHPEEATTQDKAWLVRTTENVTVQPRC
jgi:hypothetical protein